MERQVRVVIQWTATAKDGLAKLPPKVIRGLLDKANNLRECGDPRTASKPLVGPLKGYYRITYGRYRAIYTCREQTLADENVLIQITVLFVAAGIRKEGGKNDVYKFAQKLVDLGVIPVEPVGDQPRTEE